MDPSISTDASIGSGLGTVIGGPGIGTAIGGVAGGLVGLGTSIYGNYQVNQAKKMMADNQKPTYTIPPEIQQNLSQAQQLALEGLPDEQKQQYVNNLQRSKSFGLGAMNDRRAGLTGIEGLVDAGNTGAQNLLASDSAARQQHLSALLGLRSNMADYKNAAFQTNQLNPYLRQDNYEKGIQGAGIQNVANGADTLVHGLGTGATAFDLMNKRRNSANYNANNAPMGAYNPFSGAPGQQSMDQGSIDQAPDVMAGTFAPSDLGVNPNGMGGWMGGGFGSF